MDNARSGKCGFSLGDFVNCGGPRELGVFVRTCEPNKNGGLAFKAVALGSKWWARVQSSGVELETAGSHSKQWGLRLKQWGRFEMAGSHLKQWGRVSEMVGLRLK